MIPTETLREYTLSEIRRCISDVEALCNMADDGHDTDLHDRGYAALWALYDVHATIRERLS